VALCVDNKFYYETCDVLKNTMSLLLPSVDKVLSLADISISDLDGLGVCVGPGSFTGLRVSIGTIKAFAQVHNLPIATVTSTRLNAYNVGIDTSTITTSASSNATSATSEKDITIASIVDGGNIACFVSVYKGEETILEPICIAKTELNQWLQSTAYDTIVSDFEFENILATNLNSQRIIQALENCKALEVYNSLQPLYIRKPQVLRKDGDV